VKRTLIALGLLGAAAAIPASADPLGLVAITLDAPAQATCDAPFTVSGTVVLADAMPLEGQAVRITVGDVDAAVTSTDADGAYTAEILYADPGADLPIIASVLPGPLVSTATATITVDGAYYFEDLDGDGFGGNRLCTSELPPEAVLIGGDCDESDPAISPDADEVPGNDIDENCNLSLLD
jgi:hypothetical protein